MLLKLPIMLLSSAPKSSLLCSKLCSEIQIMLIGTVKFNTLKLYLTEISLIFLLIMRSVDSMIPVLSIFLFCYYIHISDLFKFTRNFTNSYKMLMTLKKSQNFTYYAGIMLDAFAILLCSKLCWHNWLKPNMDYELMNS